MNKKLFNLSLAAVATLALASGCDKEKEEFYHEDDIVYRDDATLSFDSLDMLVGDTYKLNPHFETNRDEAPAITYTSVDASVASVDSEGNISALKPGTTKVTVTYGEASASCDITVGLFNNVPMIRFNNISSSSITIESACSLELNAYVFFNSQRFDGELTYKVKDTNYGPIKKGVFTPTKKGTTSITVSGKFFDYELEPVELTVKIVDTVSFKFTKAGDTKEVPSIALYNYAQYEDKGQTFSFQNQFKFAVKVIENGIEKDVTNIELIDNNENAVTFDKSQNLISTTGGVIGSANLKISYLSNDRNTYTHLVPITVDYSYIPYLGEEVQLFGCNKGEVDAASIFASFPSQYQKVLSATSLDGKTKYTVDADGRISGLSETEEEVQTICVSNGFIMKEIKLRVYAGIISEAADLECFRLTDDETCQYSTSDIVAYIEKIHLTGTYIVTNDIDASGYTLKDRGRITGDGARTSCGFQGTFDGQGHTIYNLTVNRGGIFNNIGSGAVIKNIGFENVRRNMYAAEDRYVLASYISGASLENVYIRTDKIGTINACGNICHNITNNSAVKNCLFVMDEKIDLNNKKNDAGLGAFSSYCTWSKTAASSNELFFKDTYFVADCPLIKCPQYNDTQKKDYFFYVDTANVNFNMLRSDGEAYPKVVLPNAKHFLTIDDMKNSGETYSSFDSAYWGVSSGELVWKMAE